MGKKNAPPLKQQLGVATQNDELNDATSVDMSVVSSAGEPVYYDVEQVETERRGTSFAHQVTRQLFNTEAAASEIQPQSFLDFEPETVQNQECWASRLVLKSSLIGDNGAQQHNAEPPGTRLGTGHRLKQAPTRSSQPPDGSNWQTVPARNLKGRSTKQCEIAPKKAAPVATEKRASRNEAAVNADLIKRLEQKNVTLETKNVELARMMTKNTRLLGELLLQNETLQSAITGIMSDKQAEAENHAHISMERESGAEPMHTVNEQTPVKHQNSKKSSLLLHNVRTPPKPPEGTPRKQKKKRVSESPASTSNRFAPLQDDNIEREEDSFADAEEDSNAILALVLAAEAAESAVTIDHHTQIPDIVTVAEAHESNVNDVQQAAATPSPIQQSPGFGSNGAGQVE